MNPLKIVFLSFGLLALAANTPALADMTAEKVAKKAKIGKTDNPDIIGVRFPDINSLKSDPYYVHSFLDDIGLALHYVVVEYDFIKAKGSGDTSIVQNAENLYKHFYTAVDAEGNAFELKVFHRDFDGCGSSNFCGFEEYFRITVDDDYIRGHESSGITLYAKSRAGPVYKVEIYPAYVHGILLRLDEERLKRGIN